MPDLLPVVPGLVPGCAVRIRRPDMESYISVILSRYDTAWLVTRIEGRNVYLKPNLPRMLPEVFVWIDEIDVVDEKPWTGTAT